MTEEQENAGENPARRLVLAFAFAPSSDTSAVVAVKRVLDRGEPVDVISNDLSAIRATDPSLTTLGGDLVRRHAVLRAPARFTSWKVMARYCEDGLAALRSWHGSEDLPYTSLYSRSHFIHSHALAALLKVDRPGLTWQAEFSDIASRDAKGAVRKGAVPEGPLRDRFAGALVAAGVPVPAEDATIFVWAEVLAYALADEVLFTNDAQRDHSLALVEDAHLRERLARVATVSPQPSPPATAYTLAAPDPASEPVGDVARVGYFGNFYSSQHPATVLEACAALEPADRAGVRLHLYTGSGEDLAPQIEHWGVGDVVTLHPRLPYLDFLATARGMDVLLAMDAATPSGSTANPVLLSKWSDYVGTGRPVWGVVERGSRLAAQDLAHRSPLGHVTAAMQVLVRISRARRG